MEAFTLCKYIKNGCKREGKFTFMVLAARTRSKVCMTAGEFR